MSNHQNDTWFKVKLPICSKDFSAGSSQGIDSKLPAQNSQSRMTTANANQQASNSPSIKFINQQAAEELASYQASNLYVNPGYKIRRFTKLSTRMCSDQASNRAFSSSNAN